jgi:CDP-diacylglycerol--glycerol-3-phosphate 3-phosphatidyltransferase
LNRDDLRRAGRQLLSPLVSLFDRVGVGPSSVTVFGLLITACSAWLIWRADYVAGALVLFLGSILDAVDGELARRQDVVSKSGAVFDSSCDRIGELLLLGALLAGSAGTAHRVLVYLVPAALGGSYMVSYVRARAEIVGIECSLGLFTRTERLVLMIAGLLAAAIWDERAIVIVLAVLTVGTWFTAFQRLAKVFRDGRGVPLDGS